MAREVMVRTYQGSDQQQSVLMYAEDAPTQAVNGWEPVSQTWANGEWPMNAYLAGTLLIIAGIGIVMLIVMAMYKPKRILVVTYARDIG